MELACDKESLSVRIRLLESYRFEELFVQFPDLLAQGRFGARVIPEGADFTTPAGYTSSCRTMKNAAGMEERRYLEFDPHLEPTIADVTAELEWLRTWIEAKRE